MFRETLRETPLSTANARAFFSHIQGDTCKGDNTFVSTLRALVYPRMDTEESLRFCFDRLRFSRSDIDCCGTSSMMERLQNNVGIFACDEDGIIQLCSFEATNEDDRNACMEFVADHFTQYFSEYEVLPKVTDFFRKYFKVYCFIDQNRKHVILWADNLNMQKLHYLQCSIFAFLPWYFNPEDGVSDLEMRLIKSLGEKTPDNYLECLREIAAQYDFRSQAIRNALQGFEAGYYRGELNSLKGSLESTMNRLDKLDDELRSLLAAKRELDIKILGMNEKIASIQNNDENSEIMQYFLSNSNLYLDSVDADYLKFVCKEYLTYFDEDFAEQVIQNQNSYVYCVDGYRMNNYIEADDMERLMNAIFVDRTMKIQVCAAYSIALSGTVQGICAYDFGSEFGDCMPNPHINKYRCLGDHQRVINHLLVNNDYIGAIDQCQASCASLNFGDSVVMGTFMSQMYGVDSDPKPCIMDVKTGVLMTPKDAAKYLKEKSEELEAS